MLIHSRFPCARPDRPGGDLGAPHGVLAQPGGDLGALLGHLRARGAHRRLGGVLVPLRAGSFVAFLLLFFNKTVARYSSPPTCCRDAGVARFLWGLRLGK